MFVGETEDEVDAAMADVLRIHRGLYAQLEGNEVYLNGKTQIRPVEHEIGAEDVIANVPFGTPERVRDQVRPYHELGVDHLSLYFDYLSSHERVVKAMRLFAAEVMPEFHHRHVRYGRERLDNLLNPSHRAPDYEEHVARFAARSAERRTRPGAQLDVAYGDHPRERLDVFTPPGAVAPLPVNIFFHGGYWRSSEKERYSFLADTFIEAGAALVVAEYALVPSVPFDELIRQCRAALAYVYQHAAELGLDPGRIHVSGHSAGGQIVGMLMAGGWQQPLGLADDVVRGGCGISGLYDLEPIRLSYLNDTLGLDRATALRNSPSLLRPSSAAPLIAAVGGLEGEEFLRQNALIEDALGERSPGRADGHGGPPPLHRYRGARRSRERARPGRARPDGARVISPIIELRRYTAVPGRGQAVLDRFHDHTLALFADRGMTVTAFWVDVDDPDVLLYTMQWDDRDAMDAAWAGFVADPRWHHIVEVSEADGPIVAQIERTFMAPA